MKQVHSSVAFALAIVLLSLPAHPQSVPSSQVSANDLARRVISNHFNISPQQLDVPTSKKNSMEESVLQEIHRRNKCSLKSNSSQLNGHSLTAKQQEEEDQRVQA